jgi:glycosyltransferase involved in cell wall biosynthesis
MSQPPLVSVCIPTYNRAGLLAGALQSVLAQTVDDLEVIVSDNASPDDTPGVVAACTDPRLRYHRNARNIGGRANWNQAFSLARGRYIAPFPDDDLMLPENLACKVAALDAHAGAGLVHSKYHLIDQQDAVIRPDTNWGHGPDRFADAVESGRDVLRLMLRSYNRINLPTVLFRRECYERLGGFTDRLALAEDWEYWMRIAAHYDVAFLARPLVKWRLHNGSLTNQHVYTRAGVMTPLAIREELIAKRLILRGHVAHLPGASTLRREAYHAMACRIVQRAEGMLAKDGPSPEARAFALDMCRAVPEVLGCADVWKILLKSVLGTRRVSSLKHLWHL